jgi:hypothetical protein
MRYYPLLLSSILPIIFTLELIDNSWDLSNVLPSISYLFTSLFIPISNPHISLSLLMFSLTFRSPFSCFSTPPLSCLFRSPFLLLSLSLSLSLSFVFLHFTRFLVSFSSLSSIFCFSSFSHIEHSTFSIFLTVSPPPYSFLLSI